MNAGSGNTSHVRFVNAVDSKTSETNRTNMLIMKDGNGGSSVGDNMQMAGTSKKGE